MLFRVLLVLSVLLASAEGAPIFIRNPRSQEPVTIKEENITTVPPKTSEDTVNKIVIPVAVLFVLAVIIGAIAIIYCCLKKKKPTKDDESQDWTKDFTESNTSLNGKHQDYIIIDESPRGPRNELRDVLLSTLRSKLLSMSRSILRSKLLTSNFVRYKRLSGQKNCYK
ncbi:uncharacterized protein LOC143785083 [Ranitomeya variabilis]|uniref:uncharacterized protein LOC143785083 n=1 Tax=Ranitomeya variabilis TaxID=490064 RepID=UPI0040575F57